MSHRQMESCHMQPVVRDCGRQIRSLMCAVKYPCCACPRPPSPLCGRSRDRNSPFIERIVKRAKEFEVRTESSIVCGFMPVSKC